MTSGADTGASTRVARRGGAVRPDEGPDVSRFGGWTVRLVAGLTLLFLVGPQLDRRARVRGTQQFTTATVAAAALLLAGSTAIWGGFAVLATSPCQLVKTQPGSGNAVSVTAVPAGYVPPGGSGVTVPRPV